MPECQRDRVWSDKECPHKLSSICKFPLHTRYYPVMSTIRVDPICCDAQQKRLKNEVMDISLQWPLTAVLVVPDNQGLICMQIAFKRFLSQTVCPNSCNINCWYNSLDKSLRWKTRVLLAPSGALYLTNATSTHTKQPNHATNKQANATISIWRSV